MVWILGSAAFLTCSNHVGSLMVRMIILSMNPSINDFFASMSTDSVSSFTIWYQVGRWSSPGSK